MKQDEIRLKLIDGTIHVIARDGLDKATTKQISLETSTNEIYIYRCFADKEDLFAKTFTKLDNELVDAILKNIHFIGESSLDLESRAWMLFSNVWKFLLGNKDKCITFVRYYYSPYFTKYSMGEHIERYQKVVDYFKPIFKEEAHVWMIVSHILNTMLDFSLKVYAGVTPDNDDTAEHVFRLIHASIKQYFKTEELQG